MNTCQICTFHVQISSSYWKIFVATIAAQMRTIKETTAQHNANLFQMTSLKKQRIEQTCLKQPFYDAMTLSESFLKQCFVARKQASFVSFLVCSLHVHGGIPFFFHQYHVC